MISEVGVAAAEVAKEATKEAAKEGIKEAAKETAKAAGKEMANKAVDVTKRIDIAAEFKSNGEFKVDITKRLIPNAPEISIKDIPELAKNYISDLIEKSPFPETLKDKMLDVSKLEPQSPDKVAELREEFDEKKKDLRKDWEKLTGKEWPKYTEDVYNENGVRIRKVGDNFDAHHIQPLELGGSNTAENLTPMDLSKHSSVHAVDGSCKKLVDAVKGVERL